MKLDERLKMFTELGDYLNSQLLKEEFEDILYKAKAQNPWFTIDNLKLAIKNISDQFLAGDKLLSFTKRYSDNHFNPKKTKKVGIVAAGNIPLVGFQDLMHVILAGHEVYYKPSSQDQFLMNFIINQLKENHPDVPVYIVERLNNMDVYIATGSGNTSRYFEYYFGKKPNIIRKNRVSTAILNGNETHNQLADLGNDIFNYFGLGCRNVSKLYVPEGYNFTPFFEAIDYWSSITLHSKYTNNYDYNKSIMLVNGEKHLDNGFLLIKESPQLYSPISAVFYEEYESLENTRKQLNSFSDQLQCVVSADLENTVRFGETQSPELWDYADHIDTIDFLSKI